MKQATHLFLKPKDPEACIRDPRSRTRLPACGAKVPHNRYWRARLSDGDCVETSADAISKAKSAGSDAPEVTTKPSKPAKAFKPAKKGASS